MSSLRTLRNKEKIFKKNKKTKKINKYINSDQIKTIIAGILIIGIGVLFVMKNRECRSYKLKEETNLQNIQKLKISNNKLREIINNKNTEIERIKANQQNRDDSEDKNIQDNNDIDVLDN